MSLKNNLPFYNGINSEEKFFQVIVEHFPYIRENNLFETQSVDAIKAEIFRGDFHGLLMDMGLQPSLCRIITVFNGLNSPLDYDGVETSIRIPDRQFISDCASVYSVEM